MTRRSPRTKVVTFLGPGAVGDGGDDEVPLVANLRSVELSDHPLLVSLRDRTGCIAQEALRLSRQLAAALPDVLTSRPSPDLPSIWECFEHEFARHSLAPALMNLEIARAALAGADLVRVRMYETSGGAWWLGGSGADEALTEALRHFGPGIDHASGARWVRWRARLLPWLARRASRPVDSCFYCLPRSGEALLTEPCDVLFLGIAATSAPLIAHLTRGLEAQGLRCLTVDYHYEQSTAALREAGLRVIDGRPYATSGAARAVRKSFGVLRRESLAGVGELVAAGRWPPWLEWFTQCRLTVALARDLPVVAGHLVLARWILEAVQPRLVVGFHMSPDFVAPLMLAARLRGVPTVCSQHGIRGPVHRNGVALPWDYLLAWGQYTVDLYEGLTDEPSRWVVTGNCLYDREPHPPAPSPWGRGGVGSTTCPVVLVATQTDEPQVKRSQPRWWLRGVAEACRNLGARLVIKTHPAETARSIYREITGAFPETVQRLEPAQSTLGEALAQAAVLVTRDSTAVYEAALAGKPALTITLPPYRPRFPLAQHGGAIGVSTYEEIEPALRDALSGGHATQELTRRRPQFLEYHLGPQDGHATSRTLAALREAIGEAG